MQITQYKKIEKKSLNVFLNTGIVSTHPTMKQHQVVPTNTHRPYARIDVDSFVKNLVIETNQALESLRINAINESRVLQRKANSNEKYLLSTIPGNKTRHNRK